MSLADLPRAEYQGKSGECQCRNPLVFVDAQGVGECIYCGLKVDGSED